MYTQADASQVHFFYRSLSTIFYGEHSINSGSIELEAHSIKFNTVYNYIWITSTFILDGL